MGADRKTGDFLGKLRTGMRCAIYTRKSTEEGLEQEFNTLGAQRDAAEAFIRSQRGEGWSALPEHYDDGGFTGANMERPALQKLLQDVRNGLVDCVMVYIRSDQYNFIRRGIPSVMVAFGYHKGSPEEAIVDKWLAERYHAPSDDVNQPVDKAAAGQFVVLVEKLIERIADADTKPAWKPESFFRRYAQ